MNKPADYDNVQGFGDTPKLPAGGYVCRIMNVEETKSRAGSDMIRISLDISEGDYKGYYAARYRTDTRTDKKWGCVVNQLVYDYQNPNTTNKGFKTFNTSVVESNSGFEIQWGTNYSACFKNKLVGVLFGREEFLADASENRTAWTTKPMQFRSVETIRSGKFEIPKDKPLNTTSVVSPAMNAPAPASAYLDPKDFEEIISDKDLPF